MGSPHGGYDLEIWGGDRRGCGAYWSFGKGKVWGLIETYSVCAVTSEPSAPHLLEKPPRGREGGSKRVHGENTGGSSLVIS